MYGLAQKVPIRRAPAEEQEARKRQLSRWGSLKDQRSSWLDHWRDISEQTQPRRGRFLATDANKGWKKNDKIINSTPTKALKTNSAGMMAGITSPARPWFRLGTPDPELAAYGPVRQWLHDVEEVIRYAFARSNIYNAIHNLYLDIHSGTGVLHVEEDVEDVLRGYVFPLGQYALANNASLRADTVFREFSMTASQMESAFGLGRLSSVVRTALDSNNGDSVWFPVLHVIQPNKKREFRRADVRGMPVSSCWMESQGDEGLGYLRESGYREMPSMAVRWGVVGEDVYGEGPSMDALGDCKALQQYERRKAQLIDKLASPPMKGPPSLLRGSLVAGDYTAVDETTNGKFEPAMTVQPGAIEAVQGAIYEHEKRIREAYFADLWLLLANSGNDTAMTAREVAERHEEKMLQLGPVLTRLEDELLNPLIDRAFGICLRAGRLPPPPEEIHGQDIRVEYISVMAEAQKLLQTTGIERLSNFVITLSEKVPDALDVVNWDEAVTKYADSVGTPPNLVNSDDAIKALRTAKAQQAQQQQQAEAAVAAAGAAKDLGSASIGDDSALGAMVNGLPPGVAAQATADNAGGSLQ